MSSSRSEFSKLKGTYGSNHCDNPVELFSTEKPKKALISCDGHLCEVSQSIYSNTNTYVSAATTFKRRLCHKDPKKQYENRDKFNTTKTILHWGQRKLLLNEIEFLTMFNDLPKKNICTVLYVGSAPGIHLKYLTEIFPDYNYILYDPNKFIMKEQRNVKIFNKYFTSDDAKIYSDKKKYPMVFFWSDIRCNDLVFVPGETRSGQIYLDMQMQKEWHDIIKPLRTMFKFRLDWNDSKTQYLDGELYVQPFAGCHSTELRLITTADAPMRQYSNRVIEEQMFYHNVTKRRQWYEFGDHSTFNGRTLYDIFCHCYDCAAEYHILRNYFIQIKNINPEDQLIAWESRKITRILTNYNKFKSPNIRKYLECEKRKNKNLKK